MEVENNGGDSSIDESLYSRQLYVFGHEAQARMQNSDVLIVGLSGLGVETAKNVILSGVKSVTLYDNDLVTYKDLSANFYLSESDIGKPRATSCVTQLSALNPNVKVSVMDTELSPNNLINFSCVVLMGVSPTKQIELNEFCRSKNISFIAADAYGLFGYIFCDFGNSFVVNDTNGEIAATSMVAGVTTDSGDVMVTTLEDTRHGLESGDYVALTDIVGMEALNGKEYKVIVKGPYTFSLEMDGHESTFQTLGESKYVRGGYVTQVKKPKTISFQSLKESKANPGEFVGDMMKMFMVGGAQHFATQALQQFVIEKDSLPRPGNKEDASYVYKLACDINAAVKEGDFKVDDLNEEHHQKMIERLAMSAAGQVGPICAFLGGILGQEILKACSGKFSPIKQWYYYDCLDALPDEPLDEAEVTPQNCRYDGQIMVFGTKMQEKIFALNGFLVGAGAIGCEMLKNWAMMGVACGSGKVHVTDMDTIEKSNLSRQFLFRTTDIGAPKSTTAAKAAGVMNPTFRCNAYEQKVAPDTEHIFNDDFFESLNIVCTALDNVEARLYVDQRCLFYHIPMLESGTLGAKGNTQVVVPHKTEHYGARRDAPEKSVPVCTLKNFPSQIEHTIQWARDWYEGIFKQAADDSNTYMNSTAEEFNTILNSQQAQKHEMLTRIRDALIDERPKSLDDCVSYARFAFQDMFCNKIKQLLHSFPVDRLTQDGNLFWSGSKRPPQVVDFDANDELHLEFIKSTANLRATAYGIATTEDDSFFLSSLSKISVPDFTPSDGVKIATTDEEAKTQGNTTKTSSFATPDELDAECDAIVAALPAPGSVTPPLSIDFDKDIDDHMRVVAAVANLRARNYKIPEADLHKARGIAGKIIPAIATTTGMVAGAISLELYKILLDKPIEKHSMLFANLALPYFASQEPDPPVATTSILNGKEWKWTQWDRLSVELGSPAMTLQGFIDYLKSEYNLILSMFSSGVSIIYSDFMNKVKREERLPMTLKEVYESVSKKSLPPSQKYLVFELIVNDATTDEEVEIPYLRVRL